MDMDDGSDGVEEDECAMVVDAAFQAATNQCASEEAVRRRLMDMVGFADDEDEPDCEEMLDAGAEMAADGGLNMQRTYAMCRAWELVNDADESFREAINKAWMEIREAADEDN